MQLRILILSMAVAALLLTAGLVATPARAAPAPTLDILSPVNNAVIGNGTPVTVIFMVSNFNLTPPGTGGSAPDTGHVDVLVNGTLVSQVSVNMVTLPLPSGPQTMTLRLVADNGSALNPDVVASVSVMMTRGPVGGIPGLSVTYPADGAVLGTDLWVDFSVTQFALVPVGAPPDVPGEGHVRVDLDTGFYAELTNDEPVHLNLPDGSHTVTFELVDSGSHPLNPNVTVSVDFTVRALVGRVVRPDFTSYLAGVNILLGLAILAAMYRKLEV